MKIYLVSLGAGVLVGLIYSLLNVRSPAPPLVALVGLLGNAKAQGGKGRLPQVDPQRQVPAGQRLLPPPIARMLDTIHDRDTQGLQEATRVASDDWWRR